VSALCPFTSFPNQIKIILNKNLLLLMSLVFFIMACTTQKTQVTEAATEIVEDVKEIILDEPSPGLDLSNMDLTADPANDFFRFVNGKWLDNTEIPGDRSRWGSFDELRKKSSQDVLAVLNEAGKKGSYPVGSDQYKVAQLYKSAMDTTARNRIGAAPLIPYLDKILAISSLQDAQDYISETMFIGSRGLFDSAVFPDMMNSSVNAFYMAPGTFGLPERDYYIAEDEKSVDIRNKYVTHIQRMLGLIDVNVEDKEAFAENVLAFETKLAEAMMTKEKSRNPTVFFAKKSFTEFEEMVPSIDWARFISAVGVPTQESILIADPKYYGELNNILTNSSIQDIKNYFLWSEIDGAANLLSTEIEQANFDFYGTELSGTKEQRPLWEKSVETASGVMGEAIGQIYVDKHFPPEAKIKAQHMIANIKDAFKSRINGLEWMTAETKVKALEKLASIDVKIGYPDKWKDYSTMDIKTDSEGGSFIGNMIAASKWFYHDNVKKVGNPVDKTEWGMAPQTVNAYYNPLNNEIVFPAAILQPPFYDYEADEAVNYGGIGAVIGHEISHGFDDQGSRFDATGNMVNWWTEDDRTSFDSRNQKLIDQFANYEGLPGVPLNGEFTLGENIGDLGGINVAYDGLMAHIAENGTPKLIDGYTAEQRFFISWGTIWRTKMTAEQVRISIKTDPHALGMFRAVGPLSNMPAFYEAFDVSEGDAMYRSEEERVKIW